MRLMLEDLNLNAAERQLCVKALAAAGNIVDAAQLLGITRHALKRRMIKHGIVWPRAMKEESESEVVEVVLENPELPMRHAAMAPPSVPSKAEWLLSQLETFLPARMRNEDLGDAREHIALLVAKGARPPRVWLQVLLVVWWTLCKIWKGPGKG